MAPASGLEVSPAQSRAPGRRRQFDPQPRSSIRPLENAVASPSRRTRTSGWLPPRPLLLQSLPESGQSLPRGSRNACPPMRTGAFAPASAANPPRSAAGPALPKARPVLTTSAKVRLRFGLTRAATAPSDSRAATAGGILVSISDGFRGNDSHVPPSPMRPLRLRTPNSSPRRERRSANIGGSIEGCRR